MLTAQVAVEGLPYFAGGVYSYSLPEKYYNTIKKGSRVTVPFGRGNALRRGYVIAVENTKEQLKLKDIAGTEYDEFTINEDLIDLALFMSDKYLCPVYDCIKAMLPAGLDIKITYSYSYLCEGEVKEEDMEIFEHIRANENESEKNLKALFGDCEKSLGRLCALGVIKKRSLTKRRLSDNTVDIITLKATDEQIEKYLSANNSLTKKHRPVIEYVQSAGECSKSDIMYMTGVTASVITTLCKRGILQSEKAEVLRNPYKAPKELIKTALSKEQQACADEIAKKLGSFSVSLLYGVTGSGKTHIFYELIDRVTAMGKSAIVMVPEIMLTVQTVNRLKDRFGEQVAVIHSGLSQGERLDEWKRIKRGEAKIAVGTRTAVFAPFENIGIIIMDEEQEHTYKSDSSPRYHTRDVVRFRCAAQNALMLLCSATPSIESYYNALSGRYKLFTLNARYGEAGLPRVQIVDMREQPQADGLLSEPLCAALTACFDKGKQAILLYNRRGYHTFVSCRSCGHVITCPSCSISMTYHAANDRLICHYCGRIEPYRNECPECGSDKVRYSGQGTQRIEEALAARFPQARVLRMDADTTMSRFAYEEKFSAFARGEYDLMIGTQMVAKGLDFPNVALVGVLSADMSLFCDDYRSFETTFALLTQVIGRAGRRSEEGTALVQTYAPENDVIRQAAAQDYLAFYHSEIEARRAMGYPPYTDLYLFGFSGVKENDVKTAAGKLLSILRYLAGHKYSELRLIVLDPSPATVSKIAGKYRYKLLMKTVNTARLREMVTEALDAYQHESISKHVSVYADVNPSSI